MALTVHIIKNGKVYLENADTFELTRVETRVDERGHVIDENDDVVALHALPFKSFADCAEEQPKDWLIEGVLALNEDSSWYGPPGALKSTLALDIAVHIAGGVDWRGHRFNCDNEEYRGVIIFDLERGSLTRRRLEAYKQNFGLPENLPIVIVDEVINLMDPACVEIISDTIYEFERQHNREAGLVIFDTWSKCLGGHDEDKSSVQNYAALNLSKIRKRYGSEFHSISIGHTGKNIAAGERGSNARQGHVSLEVLVNKGAAKVTKANDLPPDTVLATFEAVEVTAIRPAVTFKRTLAQGGDLVYPAIPWTVSILAPHNPDQDAAPIAREGRTAVFKPTGKNGEALEALRRVIAQRGQDGAVPVDYWKEELTKAGILNSRAKNPWQPFKRVREALCQHIVEVGDLVRLVEEKNQTVCAPLRT